MILLFRPTFSPLLAAVCAHPPNKRKGHILQSPDSQMGGDAHPQKNQCGVAKNSGLQTLFLRAKKIVDAHEMRHVYSRHPLHVFEQAGTHRPWTHWRRPIAFF
nr:hypothetical protein [Pandoravirus aubagnensis]